MRPPTWLQELRDMLALRTSDARQRALDTWEARWLVEVRCVKLVTDEAQVASQGNLLEYTVEHIRYDVGKALGDLLAQVTIEERPETRAGSSHLMEVRGEAWVMRREPKSDV